MVNNMHPMLSGIANTLRYYFAEGITAIATEATLAAIRTELSIPTGAVRYRDVLIVKGKPPLDIPWQVYGDPDFARPEPLPPEEPEA